eukprot:6014133-Pyramimonas_sp.AAC.1
MANVVAVLAVGGPTTGKRDNQWCTGIENYFASEDWATFSSDDIVINAKACAMAQRLFAVGVTCPSNKLLCR